MGCIGFKVWGMFVCSAPSGPGTRRALGSMKALLLLKWRLHRVPGQLEEENLCVYVVCGAMARDSGLLSRAVR